MAHSSITFRSALLACAIAAVPAASRGAEEPVRIVFKSGPSIPASCLTLAGDKFVVKTEFEAFKVAQEIPVVLADHVYGTKPAAVNQAIVSMLTGKPKEALNLLAPIITEQKITAKIPGNFWLEAARATLIAHALNGQAKECTDLGKEIADATREQGVEPFVSLGKALLMPATTKADDRAVALRELITDTMPVDVCAYAAYFRGNIFKKERRNAEALEAYLEVPCLYPAGGLAVTACAELQAAELLGVLDRRDEAITLCKSAAQSGAGTTLVEEAKKRIESIK